MRAGEVLLILITLTAPFAGCLSGGEEAVEPLGADPATGTPAPEAPPADGAVAPAPGAREPVVFATDVAGDAYGQNTIAAKGVFENACAGNQIQPAPRPPPLPGPLCEAAASLPETGAVPLPMLDVLEARITESPQTLVVELDVAELDESFSGAISEDGRFSAIYFVCLRKVGTFCVERVYLDVGAPNAYPLVGAVYEAFYRELPPEPGAPGVGCNDILRCRWTVPHEVVAGAPGTIRWAVPRAVMPRSDAGERFEGGDMATLRRMMVYDTWTYARSSGAASSPGQAPTVGRQLTLVVDRSETPSLFETGLPPAAGPRIPFVADPAGIIRGGPPPRPIYDVLGIEIMETSERLTVATKVAKVEDVASEPLRLILQLGAPSGRIVSATYVAEGETRRMAASTCEYDPQGLCVKAFGVPATFQVSLGEPGYYNVSFDRDDIGAPAAGEHATQVWSRLLGDATRHDVADEAVVGFGRVVAGTTDIERFDDILAPPYGFQLDTAARVTAAHEGNVTAAEDPAGDAQLPPPYGGPAGNAVPPERFDVLHASARALDADHVALTLGVADLSQTRPLTGFEGTFYVVAVETTANRVMTVYYRDRSGAQEFFCSVDTLLHADAVSNPLETVRQPIEGLLSVAVEGAGEDTGGAGGSSGAITFIAPRSCFGEFGRGDKDGRLTVETLRISGGTFGIRPVADARTELHRFDNATSETPVTLQAVAVAPPPVPFYDRDNFWDFVGVLAAAVTFLVGLFLVRRGRSRLKKYLKRVDDAAALPEAARRLHALTVLKGTAKDDLVHGKLSEAHYVVIDRRIEDHLANARTASLSESFGDLPPRRMLKLQDIQRAGIKTHEAYRVFCDLLEDADLSRETQDRFKSRLLRWVKENQATDGI
ncbi:MAG: hypothetical protein ACT4PT_13460 [Methanobacteriota archaeon]